MQYVKVALKALEGEQCDILVAVLSEVGYDGFEETEYGLLAYIKQPEFHADELEAVTGPMGVQYTTELIPAQNWNALWESNFSPVIVENFCTIKASFHDLQVTTPYEILITPKMSFGTGHHATTQLMMLLMKDTELRGKSVLDFGTGTGVLAILAEMLGATNILAIDNDDWCVDNALENVLKNDCKHIVVKKGALEEAGDAKTDIILANINRHILLQYMPAMFAKLTDGGTIIMSGLLTADREIMIDAATDAGFVFKQVREQNNWIALVFNKIY